MHGTSFKFINLKMQEILQKQHLNLIVCHIGNGASICAIKDGKSYNTSMGLTPLEGLVMGTRCGDVDASVPLYLMRQGLNIDEVEKELNNRGGLKGLTGSADSRDVQIKANQGDQHAIFAKELYNKRLADYIVRYANDLEGKIDAIVFTAGVGENDSEFRKDVMQRVHLLNLKVNDERNNSKFNNEGYKLISCDNSQCPIYCVQTDEELMIVKDVNYFLHQK